MILYLLSRDDLTIKAVKTLASHEFKEDIDFGDSSTITIADYIQMEDGDFALIKDGPEQAFFGICKEMKPSDNGYKVTLKQKETLFDTTIYNSGEEMIESTGLEDYIVKAINDNFISSGDTLMDMDYIQISASTHTSISAKVSTIVDADNGVFNLKTFLGNVRQNYGIFLDFTVENGLIRIDVNCREQKVLNVDTKLAEVTDVSETYSVEVLAKLIVKWDTPKEYATIESVDQIEDDVGALQEDIKEAWLLGTGGIEIPEGANLNADTYKVPGNYYCRSNARAASLSNCPTKSAFTMKVSSGTGTGNYPKQDISDYTGGKRYSRTYGDLNANPSWEEWSRSYLTSEADDLLNKKAPQSHASTTTIYGQGNASNYGHVKLSDDYTSSAGKAADGVGASSYALQQAHYNLDRNKPAYLVNSSGYQTLGEFVKATTESCYGLCGCIKFKDVYNIFGFNANTWLRVWFTYQNSYTSTSGVEGMLIISRAKTAKVAFVSGNKTNGVTLEWGNFS